MTQPPGEKDDRSSDQLQQELEVARDDFRTLFNYMAQGIVYQNSKGEITAANPAAERILGLNLDQMQGRKSIDPRWKSIHEDGSNYPGDTHPAIVVLQTGKPVNDAMMGVYNPQLDQMRWIVVNAVPQFRAGDDKPWQVYSTFDDVTELHLARDKLKKSNEELAARVDSRTNELRTSEQRFRNMFENSEVAVWNVDLSEVLADLKDLRLKGVSDLATYLTENKAAGWELARKNKVLQVNAATLTLFGADDDEDFVQQLEESLGPATVATATEVLMAIWEGRKIFRSVVTYPRRDGSKIDTIVTFRLPDNDEAWRGIPVSFIDITDRLEAEQALLASEARIKEIFEIAPEAVFTLDADMNIQLFNKGAEKIFGYSVEEVQGQHMDILLPVSTRHHHAEHVQGFLSSGRSYLQMKERDGIHGRRKDGSEFPAAASVSKLETDDETIYTVMLRDTTEARQADDERRKALTQAEIANRAKSEFLANMSHELRTPLNAVIGFSQVLEQEIYGSINDSQKERIQDIMRAGSHLLNLINDILDLSKIESGKYEPDFGKVDIAQSIDTTLRLISGRAREADVKITASLSEDLPELMADERLVRQMLINLLSNAVKFTHPGGEINVSAKRRADGGTSIEVRDTGIGMNKEDIPKAMENFGQIDGSLARHHEGTGLGLPLVGSFMLLHDGTLELASEPGDGTTATLAFPASRSA